MIKSHGEVEAAMGGRNYPQTLTIYNSVQFKNLAPKIVVIQKRSMKTNT